MKKLILDFLILWGLLLRAVTHSTTARDAATNAVVDLLDGAGSKLVFRVGGTIGSPGAIAATLTFATPAFGASSSGTATANAITSDTNAAGNASPGLQGFAPDVRRYAAHLLRRGGFGERHQHDQRTYDCERRHGLLLLADVHRAVGVAAGLR